MSNTIHVKAAQTEFPVAAFITDRFSPRAFSDKNIEQEVLNTLFEAASWAPSAMNDQPWEYVYAHRGTVAFDQLWECLMPGNQPWAKNAAALVVSIARTHYASNGAPNSAALHDVGMANAQLLLQARAMDIFGHPMGGFVSEKVKTLLGLDEQHTPVLIFALGYLGSADTLEEPFKTRELTPRSRKPVGHFVRGL